MTEKIVQESNKGSFILNDGATFMYNSAFYITPDNEIRQEGYEENLMERKIIVVLYPRISLKTNLAVEVRNRGDRGFVVLFFDDMSFLFLGSRLKTAAFTL